MNLDRAGIRISGAGARDFLQGLITQDIDKLQTEPMVYTAFLNQHGRFMFDAFIWFINDSYVLDTEPDPIRLNLIQHLNKYRLRSKVQIDPVEILVTAHVDAPPKPSDGSWAAPDPRDPEMGWRTLTHRQSGDLSTVRSTSAGQQPTAGQTLYNRRRIERCIPDGARDAIPGTSTPEELHLPRLHAISFTKGCYLGQELTARIEHRGLGKRHLYTVRLAYHPCAGGDPSCHDPNAEPWIPAYAGMTTVMDLNNKPVGELRSNCDDIGLALLRDDVVAGMTEIEIERQENAWHIKDNG
jgi:folate-binding protein YgfZ